MSCPDRLVESLLHFVKKFAQETMTGILSTGPVATKQERGPVPDLKGEHALKRRLGFHLASVAVTADIFQGSFDQEKEAVKRRAPGKFPLKALTVALLQA